MRTCSLRTVYKLSGIGFSEGAVLLRRTDAYAHLVREARLCTMEGMCVTGKASNGDVRVTGRTIEKIFTGSPLLLEIVANLECDDSDDALMYRPTLEGKTAEVESVLSWSLPHVVGEKLCDSLYTRLDVDPPNTWAWFDATRFSTSDFYESSAPLLARCEQVEQALKAMTDSKRELVVIALRWWRYGWGLNSSVDEVVAFWIAIECIASVYSEQETVRKRALETLSLAFPEMASIDAGRPLRRLRDIIYDARCAAVHNGRRDVQQRSLAAQLAELAATACIRLAVDEVTTTLPSDQVMKVLHPAAP